MTVWAPCSDVIYYIWSHTGLCSSFHRTARSEEWRQISPHDQRQGADAPCTSHEAQTQFRERTDTWREVMDRVPSDMEPVPSRIIRTKQKLFCSFYFFTFCFRRERALSKSLANSARRSSGFSIPESPTSTWSPTASPTHLIPSPVYSTPVMDEPLALIKKPRPEPEKTESQNKATTVRQIQVITTIGKSTELMACFNLNAMFISNIYY